jgi:phage shock protein PspC (stress-responsive transcriptional regulator)
MHWLIKKETTFKTSTKALIMKKIININLSGRVIPIEDSAYESLQRYIESLRRYFNNEEGRDEIINDIESRIAELMNDTIKKGASAITDTDIEVIIHSMGRVEDFERADAEEKAAASSATTGNYQKETAQPRRAKGRLYRDSSDKFLGGVCAGIANYMNVDPAIVRLIFAIITFGGFGMGILIYILLWIILPVRDLDTYVGKRLFRNPDDRVISGVAGGLAAYFNKPSWAFRLIFATPLILNILFGVLNGIFFYWQRDIFPNIFIGSFSGTFVLAYIILWIVLPEASSPFEKMEMRGEKVDVNRIRQNVKEGMSDFKERIEGFGQEVKSSAQQWSTRASEFANTRGKAFASDVASTGRPVAHGCLHAIGVIFKAFFIFVAGCITLALFAALMAIIFGGVAWWPINNFLWTSTLQKILAWGSILFFIGVPIIAFMTWLIRRIVRVRSRSRYLGWIFGGLWVIGWVCAISFAASIAKDFRRYERVQSDVPLVSPAIDNMIVRVNQPEIRYNGSFGWMRNENTGWDISDDSMKYNNVKVRIEKSDDSLYHAIVYKYSFGSTEKDAQARADRIVFYAGTQDSILNMSSGIVIDRFSKFRGQGVIIEIQVPVGKKIRFDESLVHAYNPWVVRRNFRNEHYWNGRGDYNIDWDNDYGFDWEENVDYVMTTEGKLVKLDRVVHDASGIHEKKTDQDNLRTLEEKERRNESERLEIEREKQKLQKNNDTPDSSSTGNLIKTIKNSNNAMMPPSFVPLII